MRRLLFAALVVFGWWLLSQGVSVVVETHYIELGVGQVVRVYVDRAAGLN